MKIRKIVALFIVLGLLLVGIFFIKPNVRAESVDTPEETEVVETDDDGTFTIIDPETKEKIKVKVVKAYDYFEDKVLPAIIQLALNISVLVGIIVASIKELKKARQTLNDGAEENREARKNIKKVEELTMQVANLNAEVNKTNSDNNDFKYLFKMMVLNSEEMVKNGVAHEVFERMGGLDVKTKYETEKR